MQYNFGRCVKIRGQLMQSKPFFGAEIALKATCSDGNHTSTPKNVKLHHFENVEFLPP